MAGFGGEKAAAEVGLRRWLELQGAGSCGVAGVWRSGRKNRGHHANKAERRSVGWPPGGQEGIRLAVVASAA